MHAGAQTVPHMVQIKGGTFTMGNTINCTAAEMDMSDEKPAHKVRLSSFLMSECEITNSQFEEFRPSHKTLRGKNNGISSSDDEAVVYVSYYDAVEYCNWLSDKTKRKFRLPTEAEWEYACKAGTDTPYFFGDSLPASLLKNQCTVRDFKKVSLRVRQTPSNSYGLFDMHGNVEEWCLDWFSAYQSEGNDRVQKNPAGTRKGQFKITRGGSHSTPVIFLRSTCRMAMIPEDSHSQTGFRIVESDLEYPDDFSFCNDLIPESLIPKPMSPEKVLSATNSNQYAYGASAKDVAVFKEPVPYVIDPVYSHNHQPAICYCQSGDILACWYSTDRENGRGMVELCSRLHPGEDEWTKAEMFFRVPGRNITGLSLLNDNGILRHINGVEASGDWQNLAMIQRLSYDDGYTWTTPEIIEKEHSKRHQVIAGAFKDSKDVLIQLCDAGPGGNDGTSIHKSTDNGKTWTDLWDSIPVREFRDGETGTTIAGIHAGAVELSDGSILALGRGNTIEGRMPMSISRDGGRTWMYSPSEFPPISSGQRLVLMRLREGPILLISFTDYPEITPDGKHGLIIDNKLSFGLFASLSFDDGKTWPVKKLISDGKYRELDGGAWTGPFIMDETHAEPKGYMAAVQSPDGIIHLISSRIYYAFNLNWLLKR